jgi:hypothetical protein
LLGRLRAMEEQGKLLLAAELKQAEPGDVLAKALEHFLSFHDGDALGEGPEGIHSRNMKLLYYYRNRLDHYGLERG